MKRQDEADRKDKTIEELEDESFGLFSASPKTIEKIKKQPKPIPDAQN